MRYAVFCDFDGTIIDEDSTDALLERYSIDDNWKDVEARWAQGIIGSRAALAEQFRGVRIDEQEMRTFASTLHLSAGFQEFVEFCARRGVVLLVISDGLMNIIEEVFHANGLLPVGSIYANRVTFPSSGRIDFQPLSESNARFSCSHRLQCGNCKSRIVEQIVVSEVSPPTTIYIGDGRSDLLAALECGTVFAKGSLRDMLEREHRPSLQFSDFHDILKTIDKLISQEE